MTTTRQLYPTQVELASHITSSMRDAQLQVSEDQAERSPQNVSESTTVTAHVVVTPDPSSSTGAQFIAVTAIPEGGDDRSYTSLQPVDPDLGSSTAASPAVSQSPDTSVIAAQFPFFVEAPHDPNNAASIFASSTAQLSSYPVYSTAETIYTVTSSTPYYSAAPGATPPHGQAAQMANVQPIYLSAIAAPNIEESALASATRSSPVTDETGIAAYVIAATSATTGGATAEQTAIAPSTKAPKSPVSLIPVTAVTASSSKTTVTNAIITTTASAGSSSSSSKELDENGIAQANRVSPLTVTWLLDNYELADGVSLPRSQLYNHYLRHCSERNLEAVNQASFGKLIRSVFTNLKTRRLGTRGHSKYHYYGIRLKPDSVLNGMMDEEDSNSGDNAPDPRRGRYEDGSNDARQATESSDGMGETDVAHTQETEESKVGHNCGSLNANSPPGLLEEPPSPPQLPKINVSAAIETAGSQDGEITSTDLLQFQAAYEEMNDNVLSAIMKIQFNSVGEIWSMFWKQSHEDAQLAGLDSLTPLPREKFYRICSNPTVQEFVRSADCYFYQHLISILVPNVLKPISSSLTQSVRNFAKGLEEWMASAVDIPGDIPREMVKVKISTVCALAQALRRYTSLNHLAQAARAVLCNEAQIQQMLADINRVDFRNVQEQASWVCDCDEDSVAPVKESFMSTLEQQKTLEQWADWLTGVVDRALEPFKGTPDFPKAAKKLLLKWSFYSSMVIRDLTLRSAASFGSFHLIRLLYDEYMFYLVEHRVAESLKETPISIMSSNIQIRCISKKIPSRVSQIQPQEMSWETDLGEDSDGGGSSSVELNAFAQPPLKKAKKVVKEEDVGDTALASALRPAPTSPPPLMRINGMSGVDSSGSTADSATSRARMAPTMNSMNDEQAKLLEESLNVVKTQGFQMKRWLDKQKLMEALKFASNMLSELRTSQLSPKSYYELYMAVTDELRHLECFLLDEFRKGKKIADLYELVQFAGNIIPRLYLLITVGVVYIKINPSSKQDILRDLVEMCRGVQHPLRGLFLRNYLLQETRGILADGDSKSNGTGEEAGEGLEDEHKQAHLYPPQVQDTIEYVLLNFGEMNKLWVRMQHQGHTRERDKREKERLELKILVGTNLSILSQIEGVTLEKYIKTVLPSLLEQVVSCRDAIAQEYLMECIIQVFPDEFHLATLTPFLKACAELHPMVNVKSVIVGLLDRLAMFAQKGDGEGIPESIPLFDIFSVQIASLTKTRPQMPKEDSVALHVSLINMAMKCYPDRQNLVDKSLLSAQGALGDGTSKVQASTALGRELFRLLRIPVDSFPNVLLVFQLQNYKKLMDVLDFLGRRNLSMYIANSILNKEQEIPSASDVESLLDLISPLIVDQADADYSQIDDEDFSEEQNLVARLVHLFQAPAGDTQTQYHVIQAAKKSFGLGGRKRCRYTLPPLIFEAFSLARKFKDSSSEDKKWGMKCEKIFQTARTLIMGLVKSEHMELSLRLFLQGASWAAKLEFPGHETVAYDFVSAAVSLYEDELSDSKSQVAALSLIIGTVRELKCFGEENHETLRRQLASAKLLKKADQCRVLCLVSHLFWSAETTESSGPIERGADVAKCLKKALKTAEGCMDTNVQVQLHVEVLDLMLFFVERNNEELSQELINKLLARIREMMGSLDSTEEEAEQIRTHFRNTLEHIRFRISVGDCPALEGLNVMPPSSTNLKSESDEKSDAKAEAEPILS